MIYYLKLVPSSCLTVVTEDLVRNRKYWYMSNRCQIESKGYNCFHSILVEPVTFLTRRTKTTIEATTRTTRTAEPAPIPPETAASTALLTSLCVVAPEVVAVRVLSMDVGVGLSTSSVLLKSSASTGEKKKLVTVGWAPEH